jgi:hypothetical protein
MEIGFLNVMQNWHKDLSDFEMYQGEIDVAIAADQQGYDSIWIMASAPTTSSIFPISPTGPAGPSSSRAR